MSSIRLLVGLGNPGSAYRGTRHNIGRDFVDEAAAAAKKKFEQNRQAEWVRLPVFFGEALADDVVAVRLTIYMNQSGPAIRFIADALKIPLAATLIVVDDFMIPFGTLRLRPRGSSGGHNGLKSIIETFGTEEFARLRVGVGPVPGGQDPADFVLERFTPAEDKQMPALFDAMKTAVATLLRSDVEKAMNAVNRAYF